MKNNCVSVQLGQIQNKRCKETKKPNYHFWRDPSKSWALCLPPGPNTTKGAGKPPKPSLGAGALDTPLPSRHIRNHVTPVQWASEQANEGICSCSPSVGCSKGPSKVLSEFPVLPLINFNWLWRLRTLVSNKITLLSWPCCFQLRKIFFLQVLRYLVSEEVILINGK